jgi:hypothetical protein
MFEAMSGLKINLLKSEVMMVLHDDDKKLMYADIFWVPNKELAHQIPVVLDSELLICFTYLIN